MAENEYNASSIKILSAEDAEDRFVFAQVDRLARDYPTVTRDFLTRILEAAQITGTPVEHIERRYLQRDLSEPKSPELEAALLHILDSQRWKS